MKQLAGKAALVTGGAQGIGAGICRGLARAGAAVLIVDLQDENAAAVCAEIEAGGGRARHHIADITSESGRTGAVEAALAGFGGLDIVVNNAAPGRNRELLGRLSGTDWDTHHQVVLSAAVGLAEAAQPHLERSQNGAIVNISSITGFSVAVDQCSWPYHVSKAGLEHLTRYLATLLGPRGIRVNAVSPGLVDRDVGRKLSDDPVNSAVVSQVVPLRRAGVSSEIADAVVFLASEQASYITGQTLVVDGGASIQEVFGAGLRAFKTALSPIKTS